jgi:hypothetical protein
MTRTIYRGAITEPPFEGREVIVRGESFIVPELVLGARRSLSPKLRWMYEHFGAPGAQAEFADLERLHELWFEGALLALRMNYPEISAETVTANFSLSALRQCFEAAVGAAPAASGDERARPITRPPQAAASAAQSTSSPTGTGSTDC